MYTEGVKGSENITQNKTLSGPMRDYTNSFGNCIVYTLTAFMYLMEFTTIFPLIMKEQTY